MSHWNSIGWVERAVLGSKVCTDVMRGYVPPLSWSLEGGEEPLEGELLFWIVILHFCLRLACLFRYAGPVGSLLTKKVCVALVFFLFAFAVTLSPALV